MLRLNVGWMLTEKGVTTTGKCSSSREHCAQTVRRLGSLRLLLLLTLATALCFETSSAAEDRIASVQDGERLGMSEALADPNRLTLVYAQSNASKSIILVRDSLKQLEPHAKNALILSLKAALSDKDTEVRLSAATQLVELNAKDAAVPALLKLLEDNDNTPSEEKDSYRTLAALLLAQAGANAAVPALLKLLNDSTTDYHLRVEAAKALAQLGAKDAAVPALLKLLNNDNIPWTARFMAAKALAQLGAKDVMVSSLLKVLNDTTNIMDFRLEALMLLGESGAKDAAVPPLLKLLNDSTAANDLRVEAAKALAQLGAKDAAVPALLKLLNDKNTGDALRIEATNALAQLGAEDVTVPSLLRVLNDHTNNYELCAAATKALVLLGAKDALLRVLNDAATNSRLRVEAAIALVQSGAKDAAVPPLLQILNDETVENDLRFQTALILVQLGEKDAVMPTLVKFANYNFGSEPIAAGLELGRLGVKHAAVAPLLRVLNDRAEDGDLRGKAALDLAQLGEKDAALPALLKLANDSTTHYRLLLPVAQALNQLGARDAAVSTLLKFFTDSNSNPDDDLSMEAVKMVGQLGPPIIPPIVRFLAPLLERTYGHSDEIGRLRLYAHLLGRGEPHAEIVIACLGENVPESCNLEKLFGSQAHEYLNVFREVWESSTPSSTPQLHIDLAKRIAELAQLGGLHPENTRTMEYLKGQFAQQGPTYALYETALIDALKPSPLRWWKWPVRGLAMQALFWAALILVYPRSPTVQAIFFWNPWVRKITGLGWVGFSLTWVPFLRNRLLSPFGDSLLADADLANLKREEYYPDSLVASEVQRRPEPLNRAISGLSGQVILEGESGLGKTMFLRNLAATAKRPLVYLLAQRCNRDVIEAIQEKLHGFAQDTTFLRSLIFSGALDVCIDGLNEVSPDTRANITAFLENYFRSNCIVGTQPLEWTAPKTAKIYVLQRLTREQIEEFLLGREPFLHEDADRRAAAGPTVNRPETVTLVGDKYKRACREYLATVFGPENKAEMEDTERMLSNPMDLWTVAELIARGQPPDLYRLQEQQYELMAEDYKGTNLGRDFPLARFSEHCYELRLHDEVAISEELFQQELLCMERHKLVVKRHSKGSGRKG